MSDWITVRSRAAGKWQIPLLLLSLGLLGYSLWRVQPDPRRMPIAEAVEFLETLVSADLHERAMDFSEGLLARPDLSESDLGSVHLSLARAVDRAAGRSKPRTADADRQVIRHYELAITNNAALTVSDYVRLGQTAERRSAFERAVEHYERALRLDGGDPLNLRKHLLIIRLDRIGVPADEAVSLLEDFLIQTPVDDRDTTLWAIERLFDLRIQSQEYAEAESLLGRHRALFAADDLEHRRAFHRFAFLEARLLHERGRFDEAERHLRTLRNMAEPEEETHAAAGWLLGRTVMCDSGPQRPLEAMSFFSDVIQGHRGSPYAIASRIGLAEALAFMERHEEAIQTFRIAIEELREYPPSRLVDVTLVRTTLGLMAEAQRQARHYDEALRYAELAVELLDPASSGNATALLEQLAQLQYLRAEELLASSTSGADTEISAGAIPTEAAVLFAATAATHLSIARLNPLNDERAADATWQAAELLARAGEQERSAALFESFVRDRPQHPQVPRAFLRVGQLRRALGDLGGAIEAFQECYRRFPRTLDGAQALVPLAQCYMSLGPGYEDLAETALRVVLEDSEVFTPEAADFADASFLLGELLNRRGQLERAIFVLEEAVERYGDNPRSWKARYLLADSYRRSGMALSVEARQARSAETIERLATEARERVRVATGVYRGLKADLEVRDPARLGPLDRTILRLSHLYEADGYFETGDYRRALQRYEEATGRYKESTHALAAYVQMVNSHVFLGEPAEARAALARARVLADAMPDAAFDRAVSPESRDDWKRYLAWIEKSGHF